jgi:predicted ATPase
VQSALPHFALTDANAQTVGRICARLDGIPLALELAAARARAVPLDVIADRLDHRFQLLTSGNRTAVPRQQTLAATIDWSHDLLTDDERRLFWRLSVCAGG